MASPIHSAGSESDREVVPGEGPMAAPGGVEEQGYTELPGTLNKNLRTQNHELSIPFNC